MKIWITKYALSTGIECADAEVQGTTAMYRTTNGRKVYADKGEWYLNEKEALQYAEKMRARRIEQLQRYLDRLEALEF
jgi:hypothetical protein